MTPQIDNNKRQFHDSNMSTVINQTAGISEVICGPQILAA